MQSYSNNYERQNVYHESHHSLRSRRRLVILVVISYVGTLLAFGAFYSYYHFLRPILGVFFWPLANFVPMGLAIASIVFYTMLFSSTRNIAQSKDKQLDERQKIVRDRAYRLSYRIATSILLLVIWYFTVNASVSIFPTPTGLLANMAVFYSVLMLITILPTAIIAWQEREI